MESRVSNMNPKLRKVLHYISIVGTFMMVYGAIYLSLKYTIGRMPLIKDTLIFGSVPLEIPLFTVTSLLIMKKFIRISSPYQNQ